MFKRIVLQLSGRITALCTQVLVSLKALLCKLVSNLRVSITQVYQNVVNLRRHRNPLALIVPLPKKGRPVGITKSARSRLKGSKTVQTPMVLQSTPAGSKSAEVAKQLRQHAKHALKKGK